MIVKIKENNHRKIISIVDDELIGKVFNEGELILDLNSKYFNGENMNAQEIKKLIQDKDIYLVNFIGKESVLTGKRLGLVEDTRDIAGVEYAFFLKML